MDTIEWKDTTDRFVLFFDILGFKDLVQENSHETILEKLKKLKSAVDELANAHKLPAGQKHNIASDQSKCVIFSDSLIFFSKGSTQEDAIKILADAQYILHSANQNGIAIKGGMSHGQTTVDFKNSLFFGKPIISAYLLHEDLEMMTVILDHHANNKHNELTKSPLDEHIATYDSNLKYGRIKHPILRPPNDNLDNYIKKMEEKYLTVSGKPRAYIDNTMKFLNWLKEQDDNAKNE